jgi:hypothetical protein
LRFTSLVAPDPDYDELARRVAEAAADANTALEAAGALQQAAGEPDEDPIGPLICAFNYDLVSPRNTDRREQHGAFAPIVEWDGQQFLPPLGDSTPSRSWTRSRSNGPWTLGGRPLASPQSRTAA